MGYASTINCVYMLAVQVRQLPAHVCAPWSEGKRNLGQSHINEAESQGLGPNKKVWQQLSKVYVLILQNFVLKISVQMLLQGELYLVDGVKGLEQSA